MVCFDQKFDLFLFYLAEIIVVVSNSRQLKLTRTFDFFCLDYLQIHICHWNRSESSYYF